MLTFTLSKPGWIIKSIIIYNEVLFDGSDTLAVHPQQSSSQIAVPLKSDKNQELYLDINIMVGPGSNS